MKQRFKFSRTALALTIIGTVAFIYYLYAAIAYDVALWLRVVQVICLLIGLWQIIELPIYVRYDKDEIVVRTLLWRRRFSLSEYNTRFILNYKLAMRSTAVLAQAGFGGYSGYYKHPSIGRFRLYCADSEQKSFIELSPKHKGKKIYISWNYVEEDTPVN